MTGRILKRGCGSTVDLYLDSFVIAVAVPGRESLGILQIKILIKSLVLITTGLEISHLKFSIDLIV